MEACEAIDVEGRSTPLAVLQVHHLAQQRSGVAGRGGRLFVVFWAGSVSWPCCMHCWRMPRAVTGR